MSYGFCPPRASWLVPVSSALYSVQPMRLACCLHSIQRSLRDFSTHPPAPRISTSALVGTRQVHTIPIRFVFTRGLYRPDECRRRFIRWKLILAQKTNRPLIKRFQFFFHQTHNRYFLMSFSFHTYLR